MSNLVAVLGSKTRGANWPSGGLNRRFLAVAAVAALAVTSLDTLALVAETLSEAYLAVTVFVAGTLALVYGLERVFKADIGHVLARIDRWQVPAGALLGAFPGCGGAIVIVTQFTKGHVSFGTLVATLTATMGDAMFLLLAREPATALAVIAVSIVVGMLSGWIVDAVHGRGFLQPRIPARSTQATAATITPTATSKSYRFAWLALLVPGLILGLLGAFQIEVNTVITLSVGVGGALLALTIWAREGNPDTCAAETPCRDMTARIMGESSFITAWVVFAFLAYELTVHFTGADLGGVMQVWAPLVPLAAILVGFLPGCGPPIVVTTLYLSGSLPMSAQLGNAISNDGDALFPALALAPRAALVATLYSAVPAILVAYGYFLIWE